jgi:hypothetical protein
VAGRHGVLAALATGLLLAACVEAPLGAGAPAGPVVEVSEDGTALVAADPAGHVRPLAELSAADGDVVHVAVRPGEHEELTVLLLTRVTDPAAGARYELRYLVETSDGPTALYWFPWYLQVEEQLATVLDVPPLPVWSPDGSALAWVEWADEGTQLRAVGWVDDGVSHNPSADAVAYRLADVPAGVQLDGWEPGEGTTVVLTGRLEGQRWRIAVDPGDGSVAMPSVRETRVASG